MVSEGGERGSVELSLSVSPLAQIVIGCDGIVTAVSPRACELLAAPQGIGPVPFSSLVTADSASEVLARVHEACDNDAEVLFFDLPCTPRAGAAQRVSGGAVPVKDPAGVTVGAALTFIDAAEGAAVVSEAADALRKDNSELRSIADELRQRTDELNVVTMFLQSVLTSLRGAVVVIDTGRVVRVWNAEAERLWDVPRRVAMHHRLHELDLGFDQSQFAACIEAGLQGGVSADIAVSVRRPDGTELPYTVSVTPLLGPGASVHGVTLLFVDRPTA